MGLLVDLWIWLLFRHSVWEATQYERVLKWGSWTCPWNPATSLPDGKAKVQHGEEFTPSHTELVPEAALIITQGWMPFADSFLWKKQNPFNKGHAEGAKALRREEASQKSKRWPERPGFESQLYFSVFMTFGVVLNHSEPFLHLGSEGYERPHKDVLLCTEDSVNGNHHCYSVWALTLLLNCDKIHIT